MKKKKIALMVIVTVLVGLSSLWFFRPTQAQIDSFTFFIPFPADVLDDHFDKGWNGGNLLNDDIETTISITIQKSNTQINYDHWEDGLEIFLARPMQPGTEIWGDGNAANGIPPDFGLTNADDVLMGGDVIVLKDTVTLPRVATDVFFDGGDALTSIGGPIAVTLAVWPTTIGSLFAGAWELYPTNRWGTDYIIPIGQDLGPQRAGFKIVTLNVQAVVDGTDVQFDLDADGVFEMSVMLNRGEQHDELAVPNVGAGVRANLPIQVQVFAADPDASWEARAYTMIPRNDWSDDLLGSRSSDGDFWLYNPEPNPLPITVSSFTNTTTITIPAKSTARYPPAPAGLSGATGHRFTAANGRPFYGLAALDADERQDWGYTLLPVSRLSGQTLIGWAPGNTNDPPGPVPIGTGNESRVYVTTLNPLTLQVDYENDGILDQSIPLTPLEEVAITDPNDFDMTGALLFGFCPPGPCTGGLFPFLAVWGQDQSADPNQPSIDVGTGIVPLPDLGIRKDVGPLSEDVDCSGTLSVGDILQYEVTVYDNLSNLTVPHVFSPIIEDFLPLEVEYIPNSTKIIEGNDFFPPGPVPDDVGISPFPLDEGGISLGALAPLQSFSLAFSVTLTGSATTIVNTAEVRDPSGLFNSDRAVIYIPPPSVASSPLYQIDKTLVAPTNGLVSAGDLVTYTVAITNSSPLTVSNTITEFTLVDAYDTNYLTFFKAIPTPTLTTSGVITWSDITTPFGDLLPGASATLTVTFEVPQTLTAPITITNVASGIDPIRSDGTVLPTCSGRSTLRFSPTALLNLDTTFKPLTNLNCTRSVNPGDTIELRIDYENQSLNSFTNVMIEDNLPASVSYIPNSTRLNNGPIPDGGGLTLFPLDEGGYNVGDISAQQTGFLTFKVQINDTSLEIRNQVTASAANLPTGSNPIGAHELVIFNPTTANSAPVLAVSIDLIEPDDGVAASGDVARFAAKISNTSAVSITTLRVEDIFDAAHLTFRDATIPPNSSGGGVITWDDLTKGNNLLPNGFVDLNMTFGVNPASANVTNTSNTITVREAVLSDGTRVQACPASAQLRFSTNENGCPTCTPTITPPPTATVFSEGFVLPETGQNAATDTPWSCIVLGILGLLWVIWRLGRRRRV